MQIQQPEWDSFEVWRANNKIIANCKWQIGQLTNVLNYYFDSTYSRIYITQKALLNIFSPIIAFESTTYDRDINDSTIHDAGDTLTENVIYQVITMGGVATYNGDNYAKGDFFKVLTGVLTFSSSTGAQVSPALFAPTISDPSILSEVFIWVPPDVWNDSIAMINLRSIIEQVKFQGIPYKIKLIV